MVSSVYRLIDFGDFIVGKEHNAIRKEISPNGGFMTLLTLQSNEVDFSLIMVNKIFICYDN